MDQFLSTHIRPSCRSPWYQSGRSVMLDTLLHLMPRWRFIGLYWLRTRHHGSVLERLRPLFSSCIVLGHISNSRALDVITVDLGGPACQKPKDHPDRRSTTYTTIHYMTPVFHRSVFTLHMAEVSENILYGLACCHVLPFSTVYLKIIT